ncbi:MAG: hypothetical protein OXU36_21430 [Candidatus Poribacteria bacterium]|nr:hypothetical protein [Candidatus Poribacteria bacterium]
MNTKLTRRIVASFLAIAVVMLFSVFSLNAEDAHKEHSAHHHGDHMAADDEKVRCAVDGMMMKPSAMVKVEQDGKAYYFCNDMQAEMFKANPDKFLQTISVGSLTFDLNVLTTEAYEMMMSHMGMGGMIKADAIKGKTHYFSVYPIQDHGEIELGDVKLALQVTNVEGETKMALLKYSKMSRTYEGFIAMPKGEEHEVRIRVTSPAVKISL